MADEKTVALKVQIELEDADAEELDRITRQLKSEIAELEVESVDLAKGGPAPEGTKGVDWAQIGQLAVTLTPIVVPQVFEFLKRKMERKPSTPLKLKIMVGEHSLETEYDPATISPEQITSLTASLTKVLEK